MGSIVDDTIFLANAMARRTAPSRDSSARLCRDSQKPRRHQCARARCSARVCAIHRVTYLRLPLYLSQTCPDVPNPKHHHGNGNIAHILELIFMLRCYELISRVFHSQTLWNSQTSQDVELKKSILLKKVKFAVKKAYSDRSIVLNRRPSS